MCRLFSITLAFLLVCQVGSHATQIIWQSSRGVHETSNGQALDDSFVFELGIFTETFVPTAFNVSQWANNWQVADRTSYDATNRAFTSRHDVESNAAPFSIGERGYIWGYSTSSNEWFLMTSPSWTWPSDLSSVFPLEWTTEKATEIIVGTLPNATGAPHLTTANVGNQPLPILTEASWQSSVFTTAQLADNTISDWAADPDHDGHSNFLEYALGGDPLTFETNLGFTATITTSGSQEFLNLELIRQPARLATVQIEISTDLSAWQTGGELIEEDTFSRESLRLPWDSVLQRFARVCASRP